MAIRPGWQGRFYEDFQIGDIYQHPLGRTITEADNVWFTLLTMNTNPAHFNNHFAEQGEFGKAIVNSALTIALAIGQSVSDTSQNAFANLGIDNLRLTHPVFVGDTIYSESLITDMRESESRDYGGIINMKTRSLNQEGVITLSFDRSFFVYKQDSQNRIETRFPVSDRPFI